jgi:hypothetical protein
VIAARQERVGSGRADKTGCARHEDRRHGDSY